MAPPSSGDQLSKDLSLAEFRLFRDYIHEHSGIFMEDAKADSLRISLVTRATRLDCTTWDRYFEILSSDEEEFRELMSLVTINETSFFRFPAQFEVLRTVVMPEIAAARTNDNRVIRIWSAGCSTGEEPYSIGMTYLDSGLEALGWKGEVYGTDVSTKALNAARQGVYPAKSVLSVPEDVVRRHFVHEANDTYRVSPAVKRCVEFGYHNLIKEPYPVAMRGNWDIIFCRNVTIYFKLESTKRVVANYFSSLNEGGYLFIGHSETLSSISDDFDVVEVGGVFVYRKTKRSGGATGRRRHFGIGGRPPADAAGTGHLRQRSAAAPSRDAGGRPPQPVGSEATAGDTPEGRLAAARDAMATGATDEALQAAEEVLKGDPNNAEGHMIAAHAHADTGDYETALAECDRALAVNPLLPGARYILGVIYQRQGDTVRAVSELKKTIYIDPEFALAHLNLANIYKAQGRYDIAARSYENALRALYKDPSGVWTLYLGGWQPDLIVKTCERSLIECRKAMGAV
jgi:chemotaxis protein methyltransferase CheR